LTDGGGTSPQRNGSRVKKKRDFTEVRILWEGGRKRKRSRGYATFQKGQGEKDVTDERGHP